MFPLRLGVGLLIFFSALFLFMLRANFSINMLAMVNDDQLDGNGMPIVQPDVSGMVLQLE